MFDFAEAPANSPFGGIERGGYTNDIKRSIQAIRDAKLPVDRFCVDPNSWAFQADFGDITLRLAAMPGKPEKNIPYIRKVLSWAAPERERPAKYEIDASVFELAAYMGIADDRMTEALELAQMRPSEMIRSDGPYGPVPTVAPVHVDGLTLTRLGTRIVGAMKNRQFQVTGDTLAIPKPIDIPHAIVDQIKGNKLSKLIANPPVWRDAIVRKTWLNGGRLNIQVESRPLAA